MLGQCMFHQLVLATYTLYPYARDHVLPSGTAYLLLAGQKKIHPLDPDDRHDQATALLLM